MLFSSPIFLFLFLPIALAGYLLAGRTLRPFFLLGASLFFYAWGEGRYVLLLLASTVFNYLVGLLVARHRQTPTGRLILWTALGINLVVLACYKYAPFFTTWLAALILHIQLYPWAESTPHLPLGISFFTFQAMAYVIDIYREEAEPQHRLSRFALFMTLFPKIVAGPIIRYGEVSRELTYPQCRLDLFSSGAKRFVVGLGKKVLVADVLAKTADQIFVLPVHHLSPGVAWLGILCYTLQIYFDFSGYSDMAIGLGRMLGFNIRENFVYPYAARSLTEFWRRWHISLSTWLRDYLYIPLSYALVTDRVRHRIAQGEYKTNYRSAFSIVVVFTLCGLWHGAGWNFIGWGALHGVVLAIENLWLGKLLKKWPPPLQHCYLVIVVVFAWVLFRIPSLSGALAYIATLVGFSSGSREQYLSLYLNNELLFALAGGAVGAIPVAPTVAASVNSGKWQWLGRLSEAIALVLVLLTTLAYLAGSTFTPFLYRGF